MIDALIAHLDANVSALSGRVDSAAALSDLLRRNALPQHTPAAYVLPTGFRGGKPDIISGLYRQRLEESVAVLIVVRGHDRTGERALRELRPLLLEVIGKVAGWQPSGFEDEFHFARGSISNVSTGTIAYQLDFVISDQLRIPT